MLRIPSSENGNKRRAKEHLHKRDWLKESRIDCPKCQSSHVMAVRRTWYQKLVTPQQKKFWCQDCGKVFWRKD